MGQYFSSIFVSDDSQPASTQRPEIIDEYSTHDPQEQPEIDPGCFGCFPCLEILRVSQHRE